MAPSLAAGSYRVEVEAQGFRRAIFDGTVVSVPRTAAWMQSWPSARPPSRSRCGEPPRLSAAQLPEMGTIVDQHEIQTLPLNGRLFAQLVQLTPGTVPTGWADAPESGSGAGARSPMMSQVNGLPYAGSNYTIDGVANKEVMNAYIALSPPVEALEEFNVAD